MKYEKTVATIEVVKQERRIILVHWNCSMANKLKITLKQERVYIFISFLILQIIIVLHSNRTEEIEKFGTSVKNAHIMTNRKGLGKIVYHALLSPTFKSKLFYSYQGTVLEDEKSFSSNL